MATKGWEIESPPADRSASSRRRLRRLYKLLPIRRITLSGMDEKRVVEPPTGEMQFGNNEIFFSDYFLYRSFTVHNVEPGTCTLTIEADGYKTYVETLNVTTENRGTAKYLLERVCVNCPAFHPWPSVPSVVKKHLATSVIRC